jgi:hypothetical protein
MEAIRFFLKEHGINENNLLKKWELLKIIKNEKIKVERELKNRIYVEQKTIFGNTPVLGSQNWIINEIFYLNNSNIAVKLDDGHIENCAILEFNKSKKEIINVFENNSLFKE